MLRSRFAETAEPQSGCSFFSLRALPRLRAAGAWVVILLMFPAGVLAERLPLRVYTTADGLPSNSINCVKPDSHGFLWFCTAEGLSRFDGYTFTNYGTDQGLPDRLVTDFIETRSGDYWVATFRGLARFNPKPGANTPMFTAYRPDQGEAAQQVNELLEDRQGTIWVATAGVFQLVQVGGRWIFRRPDLGPATRASPEHFLEDHEGSVWIAVYGAGAAGDAGLYQRKPDGHVGFFQCKFLRGNRILSLLEDRQRRIWIGTYRGLALLVPHPQPGGPLIEHVYSKREGLLDDGVNGIFQSSDGRLWVGSGGLMEVVSDATRKRISFKAYGRAEQGFGALEAQDRDGNLWMGATRMARNGFVSYGRADGLTDEGIRSILEGQDGTLYVVTGVHNRFINRFDGTRFIPVAPEMPGHSSSWDWWGWGWGQIHFQDHTGEWWVATGYGLLRYPRVRRLEDLAHTLPAAFYNSRNGLIASDLFRLYEDSRGDVWIGAWNGPGLTRWERSTGRFHAFSSAEGGPASIATAFGEDRAGDVWLGLWEHDLARYRGGHFTIFGRADGFPDGSVLSIFRDHAGRLWAGTTRGGLVRIDDPSSEHPRFVVYTTRQGLSSNNVRAVTEDRWGRIYFWTGRGVDRLQPETGRLRHYTSADGLVPAGSDNQEAFCDRHGTLWFGYIGLSRLDPEPDPPEAALPPVRITRVYMRDLAYPVSELGETELAGLMLPPDQNDIRIEFASANFGFGEVLKYQYKLEGAESDWSTPTDLRTVNYSHLSPGKYRFLVRAVNAEGLVSSTPAEVDFRLFPPVWRRWWFLSLVALAASAVAYALHRYRVTQLVEIERVRTRIATDLHDDIGSSLTQIAILTEVARREKGEPSPPAGDPLARVADLSRELVDSMSDIVWAINPRRDRLSDLAHRMRRFASDVFSARNIEIDFLTPAKAADAPLHADVRRQVFLVFKEGVNNIARHSDCRRVEIRLEIEGHRLLLKLSDDGRGFDLASAGDDSSQASGHGLTSMRQRAQSLGGKLYVVSQPGGGTCLVLEAPVAGATFLSGKKSLPK